MRIRRRVIWCLTGLLLFLCILVIAASTAFYVSYQNGSLIRIIQKKLKNQVTFTVLDHAWYDWSPELTLSNIKLQDKTHTVLALKKLTVRMNLWSSLWHWTLVTDKLSISGLNLELQQSATGAISLKGQSVSKTSQRNIAGYWHWVRLQDELSLSKANITLMRFLKPTVNLQRVSMNWRLLDDGAHHFDLSAAIPAVGFGQLFINSIVTGNVTSKTGFKAVFDASAKGADFGKVLKDDSLLGWHLRQGGGAVSFVGVYRHGLFQQLNVYANLRQLLLLSAKRQPGLRGDLQLRWDGRQNDGTLTATSKNLVVTHSLFFPNNWPAMAVNANVTVKKQAKSWKLAWKKLTAKTQHVAVDLSGSAIIPAHWKKTTLDLTGQLHGQDIVPFLKDYLPNKGISIGLRQWILNNVLSVSAFEGNIRVKGPLLGIPYEYPTKGEIFKATIKAQNAALTPETSWPKLTNMNGEMIFENARFEVLSHHALIYGDPITNVRVSVPNLMPGVPSSIHVVGSMMAHGGRTKRYIDNSPLKNVVRLFQYAKLKGAYRLAINLAFPLADPQKSKQIEGDIYFKNNALRLNHFPLPVTAITGHVHFVKTAVSAKKPLTGVFLGNPMTLSLSSKSDASGEDTTSIHLAAILDTQALLTYSKAPLFQNLSGSSPITATIVQNPMFTQVKLYSSLQGIKSSLPAPLSKNAGVKMPLSVLVNAKTGMPSLVNASFGKLLGVYLMFAPSKAGYKLDQGLIHIGLNQSAKLKPGQLTVVGKLPNISLSQWVAQASPFYAQSASKLGTLYIPLPVAADLQVTHLDVYGEHFDDLNVLAKRLPNGLATLHVKAKQISGTVRIPQDLSKNPVEIRLDQIHLNSLTGDSKMSFSAKRLANWPALDFSAENFYWNKSDLGKMMLKAAPKPYGVNFSELAWKNKNIDVNIHGAWRETKTLNQVSLVGSAKGTDWGKALDQIGFGGFLTLTQGPVDFNLSWSGGLFKPQVDTLSGEVSFDLKNGLLSKVNPGFSRLLGLFSLEALSRRLSLNFSDMTKKGLAFNSLKGHYRLKNGIATTKQVKMVGPALDLDLKGSLDLSKKTMNQSVVVMPHVDTGLAIAATIIGGPIVGIATWLGEKLVSNTILKGKGLSYSLTGPWDKPLLKIKSGDISENKK